MKLRQILLEMSNMDKLYHGTDYKSAIDILKNGFKNKFAGNGISSSSDTNFIYLSNLIGAKWFVLNNTKNTTPTIIECDITGNILSLNIKTTDFGAMAKIHDLGNIPFKGNPEDRVVDELLVIDYLKSENYIGFSFNDKNAQNKLAVGIYNLQSITPTKIKIIV